MNLAIADPPYLGRAQMHYGPGANGRRTWHEGGRPSHTPSPFRTTEHADAEIWDDPATHRALCAHLACEFDGWAVALSRDNLALYLAALPTDVRVCAWVKPNAVPGGARVITSWEPVIVHIPSTRRGRVAPGGQTRDALVAPSPQIGHTGAKPDRWTRWVLDLIGYDPDTDTVTDLFSGSGAVTREIAQGVLM